MCSLQKLIWMKPPNAQVFYGSLLAPLVNFIFVTDPDPWSIKHLVTAPFKKQTDSLVLIYAIDNYLIHQSKHFIPQVSTLPYNCSSFGKIIGFFKIHTKTRIHLVTLLILNE